jgi:tyrosinase
MTEVVFSALTRRNLTRRNFLGASATAVGATFLPASTRAQSTTQRRFEVSDPTLPANILTSYKNAIAAMLALPPTDPRNWYRNAFVHLLDCPHQNWWFLPWHRAYLVWFERTCRQLSGDQNFALPYWDWTKNPRVPTAMFDGVLDPNDSHYIASFDQFQSAFQAPVNLLYASFSQAQQNVVTQRNLSASSDFLNAAQQMFFNQPNARGLTAANPDLDATTQSTVAIGVVRSALEDFPFAGDIAGGGAPGFASANAAQHSAQAGEGILESQPHDNVHSAMGAGDGAFMISFLSPVDPIFFLHHANLDRLWDVWTRRQTALARPTLPEGADLAAWSNEQFLFFSDENGQPVTKTSAGDYKSIGDFGYDYAAGSGEDEVPAPAVAAAAPKAAVAMRSFGANVTSRPLQTPEAPATAVTEAPAAPSEAAPLTAPPATVEVTMKLSRVDVGRRFRVLAVPAGGAPIDIGAISVFARHGDHAQPTTFTLPLPPSTRPAAAAKDGKVRLEIRVVPIGRKGGAETGRVREELAVPPESQAEVTAVRIRTP